MFDEADHKDVSTCTCMILIGVRTNDVAEEPQTPEHDRLGDRRLSRSQADFLVGDMGSERDSYSRWINYSCGR